MTKHLCIDLFCGCFGWSAGWLELGGYVVGFDLEHLPHHGPVPKNADLVIQDVLTLHGSQFRDASLILASPPCQFFSYCAMPWSRAKKLAADVRADPERTKQATALFDACFRIQREAIEAAGHFIPLVVENVRGAQKWVGRSRWNYGSFHLWGDVPALMPMTLRLAKQDRKMVPKSGNGPNVILPQVVNREGAKTVGHANKRDGPRKISEEHRSKSPAKGYGIVTDDGIKSDTRHLTNQAESAYEIRSVPAMDSAYCDNGYPENYGVKQAGICGPRSNGKGDAWFQDGAAQHGSKSPARKAASAMIAKIPLALSKHIGAYWAAP